MREFCFKHQILRPAGEQCGQCASEASAPSQREALNVLESRIADQDNQIVKLSRQVTELAHRMEDVQRAQNVLAREHAVMDEWRSNFNFRLKLLQPCDGL